MTLNRLLMFSSLCASLALASPALAQTATRTIDFTGGGTGFSGTLGGTIDATLKPATTDNSVITQGVLDITDLDIHWTKGGGFVNLFPSSGSSNNNTASTTINFAPTVISINVPNTPFSSPVTGTMDITAGDNTANAIVGVADPGVPGSDGAWDDPGMTGILNGATVDNFNLLLSNPISANATVTGGLNASIPNDIVIPDIVTGSIGIDLVLKNSSTVAVNFSPSQSLQIQNLSISAATPISLPGALSGTWTEGAHPVPGAASTMLDLSSGGADVVETTITGNLVTDLTGTVSGSIDLRADITVLSLISFGVDFDNVIDGNISDPDVELFNLNEAISLPDAELPFVISVLHDANTDVDFDDVIASLQSGTLGLTLPIDLLQQDIVLDVPATSFELGGLSFPVSGTGYSGTIYLDHLAAELGGQLVLDLQADLELGADLLVSALEENAINVVVPEPGSITLLAFAGVGLVGYSLRRRRRA